MTTATPDAFASTAATSLPVQPLTLEQVHFPFRALAAYSARAPLGGSREAGIACFIAARLANELLAPRPLPHAIRSGRAVAARAALASLAMPAALRVPLARLVDALAVPAAASAAETEELTRSRAAAAAAALASAVRGHLDASARGELEQLARALERGAAGQA